MERRSLFTRIRRSGDAGSSTGEESEQASKALDDERSAEVSPEAELPPAQMVEGAEAGPLADEQPEDGDQDGQKRKIAKAKAPRAPSANLSLVRRERRALMRERERHIRDLGGLLLEMYRRDQFREDLIIEHCAQTMGVENRIHELEAILARSTSRRTTPGPHCSCGAPLYFGARFCASCGRPTDLAATGELCARCLQPLAVGADFCASCGAAVGDSTGPRRMGEQTVGHAPPSSDEREAAPSEVSDE